MSIKKSAVILSGGKNSRMGYETKAFLKLNDRKFIDLIIETSLIEMSIGKVYERKN